MTVSVQFGVHNYCANRSFGENRGKVFDSCDTAETAVWNKGGDFIRRDPSDCDAVQGWQTPEQVAATIAWAVSLPADFSWPKIVPTKEEITNAITGLEEAINTFYKAKKVQLIISEIQEDKAFDSLAFFTEQIQDNNEDLDCIIENTLDQVGLKIKWETPYTFWLCSVKEY